jgi:HD-like signal output (HDOD) protein
MFPTAVSDLTPETLAFSKGEVSPTACILANVHRLLREDNTRIDEVADLLRLDQSLCARIVHISNSVHLKRGEPARTIEEALPRLGFRELRQLVSLAASRALVARPLDAYGMSAEQAWHEAVACAIGAGYVAELIMEDAGVAYTAGLLHSIGRQPINAHLQTQSPELLMESTGFPVLFSEAERSALGFTQAPVAAALLKSMAFPIQIIDPVRQQDDGLYEKDSRNGLRYAVTIARLLYQVVYGGDAKALGNCGRDVLSEVSLTESQLLAMEEPLREEMERAIALTFG